MYEIVRKHPIYLALNCIKLFLDRFGLMVLNLSLTGNATFIQYEFHSFYLPHAKKTTKLLSQITWINK